MKEETMKAISALVVLVMLALMLICSVSAFFGSFHAQPASPDQQRMGAGE